jgi:hypothetical protein
VALGCANAPLHAAEAWSPVKMKPMNAISLDEGDKHIVSYFGAPGRPARSRECKSLTVKV